MTAATGRLTDTATGLSATRTATFTVTPPFLAVPDPVTDSGATSWSAITSAIGTIRAERRYFTPGQGVPSQAPAPRPGVQRMMVSIRPDQTQLLAGALDSQLTALFATVRPGDRWTIWHEAEAHVDTPAHWLAMAVRCYGLFKAAAPSSARFGEVHMSYTASGFSSHGPLRQWISCPANGGPALDFIGLDMYPAASSDQTWATCISKVQADVSQVLPDAQYEITEANDSAGFLGSDAQQAQFFADGWAWAKANGCLFFTAYYGNSPSTWPPGAQTIAKLAAINASAA